jgi:hypothetical protein
MTTRTPRWLPELVRLSSYRNDFGRFLDAVYAFFRADFVESRPSFRGERLSLKRHPLVQGKEYTFWHMVSEGSDEATRQPDVPRCERIRWPRPVIEHSTAPALRVWGNVRNGERRVCLWLVANEYLVVLARRKGYLLPWTAYPVTRSHRKAKLKREYEAFRKAGTAL